MDTIFNLSESSIVTASAGSGKTHRLTTRLLQLLIDNVRSENIIAQTFTRKAAGEIYARLIIRLLDLCSANPQDPSIREKLPDGRALQVLRELIQNQDRLRVGTIDSFFSDLCKSYFIELGLPPNWEIADEKQSNIIRTQAIKSAITKVGLENFRILLDFLLSNQTPNRIIEPLVAEINEFTSILSSTPRAAWGNLKVLDTEYTFPEVLKKLEALLEDSENIVVHKGIWNTIRSINKAIQLNDLPYLCKSELIRKVSTGDYTHYKKPIPEEILEALLALSDVLQAEIASSTNSRTKSLLGILTAYQEEYTSRIKEQGKLSFSDISETINSQIDTLESSDLFSRLGMSLEHILLDEFQDTSPLQWRIIENFSKHILESSSAENSILIVGDAKQAIYGWRGGSAEVFNHLRKTAPHINEQTLDTNYRSNPGVINFVNLVFSELQNNEHLSSIAEPINSWLKEFHTHVAHKTDKDHIISVSAYPEIEDEEEFSQYDIVINDIKNIQAKQPDASIAVLFRKNADIDTLGKELRLLDIEFSSSTTSKLDSSYPIQLLISLITLACHPADHFSFVHLQDSGLDLNAFFGFTPEDPKVTSIYLREQFLQEGFARTLSRFSSLYLKTFPSELESQTIYLSISLALELERKGNSKWFEWIDRLSSTNIPSTKPSSLQILSMHKAKGLEFDYVLIPSLDDPMWKSSFLKILKDEEDPFSPAKTVVRKPTESEINLVPELSRLRASWKDSQIKEGLSLLYVALTRSIKGTYIYLTPTDKQVQDINIPSLSDILRTALFYPEGIQAGSQVYQTFTKESRGPLNEEEGSKEKLAQVYSPIEWGTNHSGTSHPLRGLKLTKKKVIGSNAQKGDKNCTPSEIIEKITQIHSLSFGTIIHKCLEAITWINPNADAFEIKDDILKKYPTLYKYPELMSQVEDYLIELFKSDQIRSIFLKDRFEHDGYEARLLIEANLQSESAEYKLSGTIDRLVLCEKAGKVEAIYLYDFKTDKEIDPSQHLGQIEHYLKLINSNWGQNGKIPVKSHLVYLHSKQTIEV